MSDITVLTHGGILQAADVASIAAAADLDLAAAATLLVKESGGGRNVWGHDDVVVAPNTYVKGGPVTESNYTAYLAAVRAGRAGRQGCGPTQLTFGPFQQRADDLGGCWRFDINCRVGFDILANHIRTRGVQDGFRAYNGSGPAPEPTVGMRKHATTSGRPGSGETTCRPQRGRTLITAGQSVRIRGVHGLARRRRATRSRRTIT